MKKTFAEIETIPIFNPVALDELMDLEEDGEKDLVSSLVRDYGVNSLALLEKVNLFENRNNFELLEHCMHSLKSSSALLGLERLAGFCQILEDKLREHTSIEQFLPRLKAEHQVAFITLRKIMQL